MDNKNSFFKLPTCWIYAKLGEVCLNPQYGWTTKAVKEGKLHLLRTSDITYGSIDWVSSHFARRNKKEIKKLSRKYDMLIFIFKIDLKSICK